ncbi:MAG: hypothetical protein JSW63_09640 [Ignavibacterium sp.]|nr:MAG: hypothetical protein JSW63_09640 [Ignavibacterium sp.]
MKKNFVPTVFEVPDSLCTNNYRLEILTPDISELDYDAVMSSRKRLRNVFGENTEWPKDDMSLKENTEDLIKHEKEFKARKAFAYTVLKLSGNKCIGCVYIDPTEIPEFDCEVYLWVRDSEISLDDHLYKNVRSWLQSYWPFEKIAFPGREISWSDWKSYLLRAKNQS